MASSDLETRDDDENYGNAAANSQYKVGNGVGDSSGS